MGVRCRAATAVSRYGDVDEIAWHAGNSGNRPIDSDAIVKANGRGYSDVFFRNGNMIHPVAQKVPNAWNLFDMLGNVWEWTNDRYDKNYYRVSPSADPTGPITGAERVTRGGAWFYPAMIARASTRHASEQGGQGDHSRLPLCLERPGKVFRFAIGGSSRSTEANTGPARRPAALRRRRYSRRHSQRCRPFPRWRRQSESKGP